MITFDGALVLLGVSSVITPTTSVEVVGSAGPISAWAVEDFVVGELGKLHLDAGLTARLTTAVTARTEQARAARRAEERERCPRS